MRVRLRPEGRDSRLITSQNSRFFTKKQRQMAMSDHNKQMRELQDRSSKEVADMELFEAYSQHCKSRCEDMAEQSNMADQMLRGLVAMRDERDAYRDRCAELELKLKAQSDSAVQDEASRRLGQLSQGAEPAQESVAELVRHNDACVLRSLQGAECWDMETRKQAYARFAVLLDLEGVSEAVRGRIRGLLVVPEWQREGHAHTVIQNVEQLADTTTINAQNYTDNGGMRLIEN